MRRRGFVTDWLTLECKPPQSIDQVAAEFIKDLLRHFHHDPPDVSEDQDEAAAA